MRCKEDHEEYGIAKGAGIQRLKGKVALVTGAGGWNGIGRAVALRLADGGADLAVADIKHSPKEIEDAAGKRLWLGTDSVAQEIEAGGATALSLNFDIRSEKEGDEAISRVIKHFGHIDILVNNAGAAQGRDRVPAVKLPLEEWDRVIETNLKGTFLVSRVRVDSAEKARNSRGYRQIGWLPCLTGVRFHYRAGYRSRRRPGDHIDSVGQLLGERSMRTEELLYTFPKLSGRTVELLR